MMSLWRVTARSALGRTSIFSSWVSLRANFSAASGLISQTWIVSSLAAAAIALAWMRPCTPAPQIVATRESRRARWRAASVVAAPVRLMVISIESISASGRPLVASAR